jgi:hypothetical protein
VTLHGRVDLSRGRRGVGVLSDAQLRVLAGDRIKAGRLSCKPPARTWGSRGIGEKCDLCDEPIGPGEIEYEVQLFPDQREPLYRFHIRCHAAWQKECGSTASPA